VAQLEPKWADTTSTVLSSVIPAQAGICWLVSPYPKHQTLPLPATNTLAICLLKAFF
jgi:hypothetical protein